MTFEFFNKFHRDRWNQKKPFTFWYCVHNFYLWKDIVGKKVSKLRSIAELRAFYGMVLMWKCRILLFCRQVKKIPRVSWKNENGVLIADVTMAMQQRLPLNQWRTGCQYYRRKPIRMADTTWFGGLQLGPISTFKNFTKVYELVWGGGAKSV
jgi:hypothetical protein